MDLGKPMPLADIRLQWMELSSQVLMNACHFCLDGNPLCYETTTSDIIII